MGIMTGQVAIITGASSAGIGGAVARRFASSGASLFLTSIDGADLARLTAECRDGDGKIVHEVCDLSAEHSAERMVENALESLGRVDVLVNNAGMRVYKPFGEFTTADFDAVVAVNLRAAFMASQAVLPAMRRQSGGRIIHVASQMGVVTSPSMSLYGATKAGLISLARSMAIELAPERITVNAVSPGPIATGYMEDRFERRPDVRDALEEKMPLGRLGDPDEIAEAIHFLATCQGELMQGHNLILDGGYVAQ